MLKAYEMKQKIYQNALDTKIYMASDNTFAKVKYANGAIRFLFETKAGIVSLGVNDRKTAEEHADWLIKKTREANKRYERFTKVLLNLGLSIVNLPKDVNLVRYEFDDHRMIVHTARNTWHIYEVVFGTIVETRSADLDRAMIMHSNTKQAIYNTGTALAPMFSAASLNVAFRRIN